MDDGVDLERLYALVPTTEEEDLLEEVARSRVRLEWDRLLRHGRCLTCWYLADGPGDDCCAVPVPDDPVAEDADDEDTLTPAQVLGLVAAELGAVVLHTEVWGFLPWRGRGAPADVE